MSITNQFKKKLTQCFKKNYKASIIDIVAMYK
jgi:hypothetical protein